MAAAEKFRLGSALVVTVELRGRCHRFEEGERVPDKTLLPLESRMVTVVEVYSAE